MTKQVFHEMVSMIAENLKVAMYEYLDGHISIEGFKQELRDQMSYYPYGWHIAQEGDCEYDENMVEGELYPIEDFWSMHDFKDIVADFIADAHNWDESRFTATGSNSFLLRLVGEEALNY